MILPPGTAKQKSILKLQDAWWLRGPDLNQRPSGYEPDELPDCSTLRYILNYRHFFLQIYHILKILLKTIFFAKLTDKFQCSKHCLRCQPQAQQWCRRPESNRYGKLIPQDFKSWASASSATPASSITLSTYLFYHKSFNMSILFIKFSKKYFLCFRQCFHNNKNGAEKAPFLRGIIY